MTKPDPVNGLRAGVRAVIRHRIENGVTDALGDLVAVDADTVSVRTRRGVEVIDRDRVVAAKEVPPKPARRGAPHLAISMDDLEAVTVNGWPAIERAELGGWLLRSAAGFTCRANSVLPLGNPGVPLSVAVNDAQRWYTERDLRPVFVLFGPEGFTVEDDPLGRELLERGYQPFNTSLVMTTATRTLPGEVPHACGARVRLESALSQRWWAAYESAGRPDLTPVSRDAAKAVMTGSPDQLFASLEVEGRLIGIARVAFADAWAGLFALHVEPDHRRAGVAAQLIGALADATRAGGIRSMYLQVEGANAPARNLFDRAGFSTHHEYLYLGR